MAKCAFIGLGVMGFPMAGHLSDNGHEVTVWNRTPSKAQVWGAKYKGQIASTIEAAVKDAEFVILCVGDDADVYGVVKPALSAMSAGALIIDHTTASSECAQTCNEWARKATVGFIDAPISGGESGAISGQLTIMCGGRSDDFMQALPIMNVYAKAVKLMGESGAGQLTKMVNQICIAGILQGLAEGVHFAQKAGLDINEVVQAIGKGAAQSWQMDNRATTMGEDAYDFGFAVDWMRKDLGIALKTANEIGADLTLAAQVDAYYADIQAMGGGRWDTSSLLRRLK